ncbi:acyl-CoA--6-aminopenicillanic acid acyl-transferase [Flavobacterium aquariorum]|uniref:Acyl-CoA--6-aminopenicillanic acid acyl-transferase n=1 Tax=Flavobacterium aquariorum TaxID=2217670 RepID=A0A2W7TRR5_9FLAO|nr:C45 family peptidase [Flavobacterium aquariorum]PZX91996.1 acyl-CoA--6-aminopenicillanic acid acyl-transferase [Flavobacterium aquariorum]
MKKHIVHIVFIVLAFVVASCGTSKSMRHQPEIKSFNNTISVVTKQSSTIFYTGNNFLLKNKQNLWELYVEGDPLERGLAIGSLTDSLLKKQEYVFFDRVDVLIPSNFKRNVMMRFLNWYNRKLYLNVDNEYQTEIYGLSQYAPKDLSYIAPSFLRDMYLHGAHDIGHAVQDLALVGCTSFAAWGNKTEDGNLILGRNFDFYVDDAFAKDKIVAFINPKEGYPFMMVTWPGMIGVCSGMNAEGLTLTINASKSKIPLIAKTPISILTREILQYARTIDEAIAIAKKKKVFVSESIMIGSANDNKAVLIEIAPDNLGIFEVSNDNQLVCTNHFQSDALKENKRNRDQIKNSHSQYRFDRMTQLLDKNPIITPQIAVDILRNKEGLNNIPLGFGNDKALNHLLAHHGIVFQPSKRLVWVSASPYQLGEFVCYDLNTIFINRKRNDNIISLEDETRNIPKDPFLETVAYQNYEQFRIENKKMDLFLKKKEKLPSDFIGYYQSLNPDYWVVYYNAGLYFYQNKKYALAQEQFEKALTKEISTLAEKQEITNYLKKIKRKRE